MGKFFCSPRTTLTNVEVQSCTSCAVKSSGTKLAWKPFPGVSRVLDRESTREMPSIQETRVPIDQTPQKINLSTDLSVSKLRYEIETTRIFKVTKGIKEVFRKRKNHQNV